MEASISPADSLAVLVPESITVALGTGEASGGGSPDVAAVLQSAAPAVTPAPAQLDERPNTESQEPQPALAVASDAAPAAVPVAAAASPPAPDPAPARTAAPAPAAADSTPTSTPAAGASTAPTPVAAASAPAPVPAMTTPAFPPNPETAPAAAPAHLDATPAASPSQAPAPTAAAPAATSPAQPASAASASASPAPAPPRAPAYVIFLLGGAGVGKSSLSRRFVTGRFLAEATGEGASPPAVRTIEIAVDGVLATVALHELSTGGNGLEAAPLVEKALEQGAKCGFMLVYSVPERASVDRVIKQFDELLMGLEYKRQPMVLVGNKADTASTSRSEEDFVPEELANEYEGKRVLASALTNRGVDEAFTAVLREIRRSPVYAEPSACRCSKADKSQARDRRARCLCDVKCASCGITKSRHDAFRHDYIPTPFHPTGCCTLQ